MSSLYLLETIAEAALPVIASLPGVHDDHLLSEYDDISPQEAAALHESMVAELLSDPDYARYAHLRTLTNGNEGGLVLDCAVSCAVYPELLPLIESACDGGCSLSMSSAAGTALQVDYADFFRQHQALSAILPHTQSDGLFVRDSFSADARLLNYIAGVDVLPPALSGIATLCDPAEPLQPLYIEEAEMQHIKALLSCDCPLQIAAENGRGKRLLLHHALKASGKWALMIDAQAFSHVASSNNILWYLRREALLTQAAVVLYNITEDWQTHNETSVLPSLLDAFRGCTLCFLTDEKLRFTCGHTMDWERIELGTLHLEDCVNLWCGYCAQLGIKDIDPRVLGAKYRMNPAQIAKAARSIASAPSPTPQVLLQACLSAMPPASGNIRLVQASYTFDDLKVSQQTRRVLENICAHVNHREQVYIQWGMEKRYAYGRCVSALFAGAPGTGKTMAAHALSTALSIPLYSINLSQVVDKYIGETEKKLEQIFTLAERSNTILFFDEADSLFGKRSEVNDSKDRYANIEVSYILQRLEQFDGIVILATNNRSNMDDAFLRRIRFVADFQMPNETLRKQIWQGCFARETPLRDVDLDFIARKFEFSGGDIKNIALNAAFLAAQDHVDSICMEHVLESIRMEYLKSHRVLMRSELGEYGYLLFDR